MRKAVLFDSFMYTCQFHNGETADGYGCDHPEQEETVEEDGKEVGRCYIHSCPLGIEAEQQDLTDKEHPDAIKDVIDWDGLCEDGEVVEGEYLLVDTGETASENEKRAIFDYDIYMHRYDKKWLDEHGIENELAE